MIFLGKHKKTPPKKKANSNRLDWDVRKMTKFFFSAHQIDCVAISHLTDESHLSHTWVWHPPVRSYFGLIQTHIVMNKTFANNNKKWWGIVVRYLFWVWFFLRECENHVFFPILIKKLTRCDVVAEFWINKLWLFDKYLHFTGKISFRKLFTHKHA